MTTDRPDGLKGLEASTLGGFTAQQLLRLCHVTGVGRADAQTYADVLLDSLGRVAQRPLDLPPPSESFLSDDHTPVEFSLSFLPGAVPALRVLVEPGCGAEGLLENGRSGLRVIRGMAQKWGFGTGQLDLLEDLFFPAFPQGLFAIWCALELRPGGVPRMKVYLNPGAAGTERAAATVREALVRLDHHDAFSTLPPADGYPFFALDMGDYDEPRIKVYVKHNNLSAADASGLAGMNPGFAHKAFEDFFNTTVGCDRRWAYGQSRTGQQKRLTGMPAITCHSYTRSTTGLPSGFTLHIPIRGYARHDGEAFFRAAAVLGHHNMSTAALPRALAAVTSRPRKTGSGLIAYLALSQQLGQPIRVTVYISSEAYEVRPPAVLPVHRHGAAD